MPQTKLPTLLRKLDLALSPASPNDQIYQEALRFRGLLDARPDDQELRRRFENSALAAGGIKMAAKQYDQACEIWSALRVLESSREKAERSLAIASLEGAREAESKKDDISSLKFWRILVDVEPQSKAAAQGILQSTRNIVLGTAEVSPRASSADAEVATEQVQAPAGSAQSLLRRFARALARRSPSRIPKFIQESDRLEKLLAENPGDVALQRRFERAALMAGRLTTAFERYEDACRILSSLRRVPASVAKANQYLAVSALRGGRKSEAEGRLDAALRFWQYLKEADPQSHVAIKGIARCSQSLR